MEIETIYQTYKPLLFSVAYRQPGSFSNVAEAGMPEDAQCRSAARASSVYQFGCPEFACKNRCNSPRIASAVSSSSTWAASCLHSACRNRAI